MPSMPSITELSTGIRAPASSPPVTCGSPTSNTISMSTSCYVKHELAHASIQPDRTINPLPRANRRVSWAPQLITACIPPSVKLQPARSSPQRSTGDAAPCHDPRVATGAMLRAGVGAAERDHVRQNPRAEHLPWGSVLVLFAGAGHDRDLPARLRARGLHVTAIDTKLGDYRHDVTQPAVSSSIINDIAGRAYDAVFIATPCSSYSVAHRPQLRSRRQPMGITGTPPEWRRYLAKHNLIGSFTAAAMRAAHAAGVPWAVENPADRGDRDSPAFWDHYTDHAPLWLHDQVAAAISHCGGVRRTFAQCSLGSRFQKWTNIVHSPSLSPELACLDEHACPHGRASHEERAHGLALDGRSLSDAAAAYPDAMNELLARAITRTVISITDSQLNSDPPSSGGRIVDGRCLGSDVARACEEARHRPPRWASLRNHRHATVAELSREPLPGDLHHSHISSKPVLKLAARLRAEREREATQAALDHTAAARQLRIDGGPIHITELYLDGVYDSVVTPWLERADRAAAAIKAGQRSGIRVPTVTIGQDQMQPWARGVVWDTRDPLNCIPVERSTRATIFPGARQIDREALRRVATDLHWHDHDIVEQACGGGIEARSHCPLDTVLAFHHPGLISEAEAAAKVISADLAEGWVAPPTRHLPYVPCRLLPRSVIMQERARLIPAEDGGEPTLESYLKPRVTLDGSHGGDAAPNAGVESHERSIYLPAVQDHARGLAICDTAGGQDHRASSFVVDAESAYRFCPVQHADLWTQCFLWWDDDGHAVIHVDRRLGFGGAFAPNRFQRVSTIVAAHIQSRIAAFDATQPIPPAYARWHAARSRLQKLGQLPSSSHQLHPRYIQVYMGEPAILALPSAPSHTLATIPAGHTHSLSRHATPSDDFNGAALNDGVTPPPEVESVPIDPAPSRVDGATHEGPLTRVHIHAQLAVLGLRDVGLAAAPGKVTVGDPVVSLGLRVCRAERQINVPSVKRASMLASITSQRDAATSELRADRAAADTLVGRAVNMSQVFPELNSVLHGGYAVSQSSWVAFERVRRPHAITFKRHSDAHSGWLGFLDVLAELVFRNSGVSIAPAKAFSPIDDPCTLVVTTDASGVDGVGGYVFHAASPHEVWIVSEQWPSDIQSALDDAAAGTRGAHGALSMPAAELFGSVAIASAVAQHLSQLGRFDAVGGEPRAVYAVTDCSPAACAINAATSGTPQMRSLLRITCHSAPFWLGVAVPRELNIDADRLSHPHLCDHVMADACAAGLSAHRVRIAPESSLWTHLRQAAAVGIGHQQL